jgi:hypothetical protein
MVTSPCCMQRKTLELVKYLDMLGADMERADNDVV